MHFKCCVCGSKNKDLYKFPKNVEMKQKWFNRLRKMGIRPNSNSKVCSEHFIESDFHREPLPTGWHVFKNSLQTWAVPSVFFCNSKSNIHENPNFENGDDMSFESQMPSIGPTFSLRDVFMNDTCRGVEDFNVEIEDRNSSVNDTDKLSQQFHNQMTAVRRSQRVRTAKRSWSPSNEGNNCKEALHDYKNRARREISHEDYSPDLTPKKRYSRKRTIVNPDSCCCQCSSSTVSRYTLQRTKKSKTKKRSCLDINIKMKCKAQKEISYEKNSDKITESQASLQITKKGRRDKRSCLETKISPDQMERIRWLQLKELFDKLNQFIVPKFNRNKK